MLTLYIHAEEKTAEQYVDDFIRNLGYVTNSLSVCVVKGQLPEGQKKTGDWDICLVEKQAKDTRNGCRLKVSADSNPSDVVNYCFHYTIKDLIEFAQELQRLQKSQPRYEKDGRTYCDKECTMLHSFDDEPAETTENCKVWYQCGIPKRSRGRPVMEDTQGTCSVYMEVGYEQ